MINSILQTTPNETVSNSNNLLNHTITPYEAQKSFANTLNEAISKVNEQQIQSNQLTNKLVNGEDVDLHEVMISAQKASITLNATVEIRNKVIEAYQEIMRMSV